MKTKPNLDFKPWQIEKDRNRLQKQIFSLVKDYEHHYEKSSIVEASINILLKFLVNNTKEIEDEICTK